MEIPLFPLRTVLFPGMELPLRIFEPRYKQMLRDILEEGHRFGVVLIKEGPEVGGGAIPHDHGTLAAIENVEPLENGQIMLTARGVQRFELTEMLEPRPYPRGRVRLLSNDIEGEPDVLEEYLESVRRQFPRYFQLALAVTDQWARSVPLPDDPHRLVDFVGPWLQVPEEVKQRLIADEPAVARVEALAMVLEGLVAQLGDQAREHHRQKYGSLAARN